MAGIYHLKGSIKHYEWGGKNFLPALLQQSNPEQKPCAEYWLGVHPQDDCRIETEHGELLLKVYLRQHTSLLGSAVEQRFGHLPYLLKVLDVKEMLSIQVHPSKKEAEAGFAHENESGLPLNAPNRNYKDDNHKPELMVALSDFWLLHGFRQPGEIEMTLKTVPEFYPLLSIWYHEGLKGLYAHVMRMHQSAVNEMLLPLLERVMPLYDAGKLDKHHPDFWAARAGHTYCKQGQADRGIFSIYLFNLLHLTNGQGIFQDAGVPHAYLEGQNVEIMANSDNVLRGGLTPKHIDVDELLKHVICTPTTVRIMEGQGHPGAEVIYPCPVPDFRLGQFTLPAQATVRVHPATAEILLAISGSVMAEAGGTQVTLQAGMPAAMVFPGETVDITALSDALLFRASVPVEQL